MLDILERAINKFDDVLFVGRCNSGGDAVRMTAEKAPHLVLLDIEMPGLNGIDAAAQIINNSPNTKIIFITAYADFMPQAFEIYAYDYILKPFKLERLHKSVERVKKQLKSISSNPNTKDFLIEFSGKITIEKPEDILIIQREDRHTGIITKTG